MILGSAAEDFQAGFLFLAKTHLLPSARMDAAADMPVAAFLPSVALLVSRATTETHILLLYDILAIVNIYGSLRALYSSTWCA